MIRISLVVMTLNEEATLRACLESARDLAEEMVVVDSGSSDATVAIATELGARVIHQPFLGFRRQREFAIARAGHDHVLALDADERVSPRLADSIRRVREQWTAEGYVMNRLNFLGDTPLYHGGWYPDRKLRLFDRRHVRVEGEIHEQFVLTNGSRPLHLEGDLLHRTNPDLSDRIRTINAFSTKAAEDLQSRGVRGGLFRVLVKPAFRFFGEYLLRRGFLDGFAGYVVARTSAQYVFLREAKLLEMQRRHRTDTPSTKR